MKKDDLSLELEPKYSTNEIAGKCLRCLGEQELNFCLQELLRGEPGEEEALQRYELLVGFLNSPDFQRLLQESEQLLSDGKNVALRLELDNATGEARYVLVEK